MPLDAWAPTVTEVGALVRSRTRNPSGAELGTFTDETRPTAAEATALVADAQADIAAEVGEDVPDRVVLFAKSVVALGTALQIELTYFPEQVATGRSPYDQLKALYDQRFQRLVRAVADAADDGTVEAGELPLPVASFPDVTDMVGWETKW